MDKSNNAFKEEVTGTDWSFVAAFHKAGLNVIWGDVRYGIEMGYLSASDVEDFAVEKIKEGQDSQVVLDLAWPENDEREIESGLHALTENDYDSAMAQRRWRYVLVRWIQEADVTHEERMLKRDLLYLSFGCPMDLNFISSVVTFGDDFWREPHTAEECRKHHRERIEEFLREEAAALGAVDNKRE